MIKAEPLSYALGAELTSIDMRETLGEQDIRLIQETWHGQHVIVLRNQDANPCLLYTSPSPRDRTRSRMPSSA